MDNKVQWVVVTQKSGQTIPRDQEKKRSCNKPRTRPTPHPRCTCNATRLTNTQILTFNKYYSIKLNCLIA